VIGKTGLFSAAMRPWRVHHGLTVLRLNVDIAGADLEPRWRAGDLVLARWWHGQPPFAKGWMVQDISMSCILNEPDVDVVDPAT